MRSKPPYRFRLLHIIDALAAIWIVGIFVGLYWVDLPGFDSRPHPLRTLIPFGLFAAYMAVRRGYLTRL